MRLPRSSLLSAMAAIAYLAVVIASMVVDSEVLPGIATTATVALLLWAAVAAWLGGQSAPWWFGFSLFGSAMYLVGNDQRWNYQMLPTVWLIERLADAVYIAADRSRYGNWCDAFRMDGEWRYYESGVHLLLSVVAGVGGGMLVCVAKARRMKRDRGSP